MGDIYDPIESRLDHIIELLEELISLEREKRRPIVDTGPR
jgi:hypothetical protein